MPNRALQTIHATSHHPWRAYRFEDGAHQIGGIGVMAGDRNSCGRIDIFGTGRSMLYSK